MCGLHFPSIVGYALPYAWIGNSAKQCPDVCAYLFYVQEYMAGFKAVKSPNGDESVEGMISAIAHEVVELAMNPFVNA